MNRILLLLALLPGAVLAQVPAPAGSATTTRSSTQLQPPAQLPAPVRPVQPQPLPVPTQPAPLPAPRPLSTPPAAGPIRSAGPAQVLPAPASTAPAKVYDREGRIVPGVRPAGPNRVFDTRTGRYYDSVPAAGGQQIRP